MLGAIFRDTTKQGSDIHVHTPKTHRVLEGKLTLQHTP